MDENVVDTAWDFPPAVQNVVYTIILLFALVGNSMFINSIRKHQAGSVSGKIITNLAVCDLTLVIISIPTTLAELNLGYFPFGRLGCHIIYPLTTLAVNSAALTLVFLAIERYVAICKPFHYHRLTTRVAYITLTVCHLVSLVCVLPYSLHSHMVVDGQLPYCEESWGSQHRNAYTILLFAMQYGCPLPVICILYSLTWRHLKESNRRSIRAMEKASIIRRNKKGAARTMNKGGSEVVMARRKQTVSLLRLFVTIVIVFAVFMLPNQITWLYIITSGKDVSNAWRTIAYWLTYTNTVLNPIVYGTNTKLRKSLKKTKHIFKSVSLKDHRLSSEKNTILSNYRNLLPKK